MVFRYSDEFLRADTVSSLLHVKDVLRKMHSTIDWRIFESSTIARQDALAVLTRHLHAAARDSRETDFARLADQVTTNAISSMLHAVRTFVSLLLSIPNALLHIALLKHSLPCIPCRGQAVCVEGPCAQESLPILGEPRRSCARENSSGGPPNGLLQRSLVSKLHRSWYWPTAMAASQLALASDGCHTRTGCTKAQSCNSPFKFVVAEHAC